MAKNTFSEDISKLEDKAILGAIKVIGLFLILDFLSKRIQFS